MLIFCRTCFHPFLFKVIPCAHLAQVPSSSLPGTFVLAPAPALGSLVGHMRFLGGRTQAALVFAHSAPSAGRFLRHSASLCPVDAGAAPGPRSVPASQRPSQTSSTLSLSYAGLVFSKRSASSHPEVVLLRALLSLPPGQGEPCLVGGRHQQTVCWVKKRGVVSCAFVSVSRRVPPWVGPNAHCPWADLLYEKPHKSSNLKKVKLMFT